jgi:hypothetical protein
MNLVWIGVAVAAVVLLAVVIKRLVASGERTPADADFGSVSEKWLSEQRADKSEH